MSRNIPNDGILLQIQLEYDEYITNSRSRWCKKGFTTKLMRSLADALAELHRVGAYCPDRKANLAQMLAGPKIKH